MPRRLTNLLLLALVLAQVASGVLGWVLPEARALPLYDLHRGLGLALVLLLAWKQVIVRSSLRRRLGRSPRDRSVLVGGITALALLGSLGLGLAWTAGAEQGLRIEGRLALRAFDGPLLKIVKACRATGANAFDSEVRFGRCTHTSSVSGGRAVCHVRASLSKKFGGAARFLQAAIRSGA